jgi:hypothetical protein
MAKYEVSIYIPIKSMRSTSLAISDASPPPPGVSSAAIGSPFPQFQKGPSAYACGALKPTNVCAPFPGRGENLEWKLLKQRRTSSRGPNWLVLKSSYGGRRRNMKSHSAQGKGRVPDERGHEKTAEMSIGRSGV